MRLEYSCGTSSFEDTRIREEPVGTRSKRFRALKIV